jgi:hypothetical protein
MFRAGRDHHAADDGGRKPDVPLALAPAWRSYSTDPIGIVAAIA